MAFRFGLKVLLSLVVLHGSSYAQINLWRFDEGVGETTVDSAGARPGTLVNEPPWVQGVSGNALSFNGSSQYVRVASEMILGFAPNFTIEAWVKWDGLGPQGQQLIYCEGSFNDVITLFLNNGVPSFTVLDSAAWKTAAAPSTLPVGEWHHLAAVLQSGVGGIIYVDGQPVGTNVTMTPAAQSGSETDIGRGAINGGSRYFSGIIDEVRLFNSARSAGEIMAEYRQFSVPPSGADLHIEQTVSPNPVLFGENVTYSIIVSNHGPDPASNVVLTDSLPGELHFVSATVSQGVHSFEGSMLRCELGTLGNNAFATVTITAKALAAAPNVSNLASISGSPNDPNIANNSSSISLEISAIPTVPEITLQPQSQTVIAGADVTFTVFASGTEPFTYQWRKDAIPIPEVVESSYTRTNVQEGDMGIYSVVVTNPGGSVTSADAVLSINFPPTIVTQPEGRIAIAGETVTFSVVGAGSEPLTYQWRKTFFNNGTFGSINVPGGNGASLTLTGVQPADAGTYLVQVRNAYGSVFSRSATLNVYVPLSIITHPEDQTVLVGTEVTFNVVADGTTPLSYQWRKNVLAIAGANSASFTIPSAQLSDSADYDVLVTDPSGSVTSRAARLRVEISNLPPIVSITSPLNDSSFTIPAPIEIRAQASDPDGTISKVEFYSGRTLIGSIQAEPFVVSFNPPSVGDYSITATAFDNSGSSVTSASVLLKILPPALKLASPDNHPNGRFSFHLTGPAGRNFFLQTSTDLVQWQPFHYDTLTTEAISLVDNYSSGLEQHFFRAMLGDSPLNLTQPPSQKGGPFSLLRVAASGLDPSAETTVRFITENGASIIVPAVELSSSTLTVPVPFISSTAEVSFKFQVIQKTAAGPTISRTLSGLQVTPPPQLSFPPGSVTLSVLKATALVANENLQNIVGTTWDNAQIKEAISNQISTLDTLIPLLEAFVNDPSKAFSMGTLDGKDILLRQSDLAMADRHIVSWLQAIANGGVLTPIASLRQSALVAAPGAGSCISDAAGNAAQATLSGDPQYDRFMAPVFRARQDTLCAIPEVFNTSFLVVGGSAGVAIGAPLLAFGELATAAVALPTAALLAVTLELSGGQIALGGALAQATDAAKKLVQDGIHRVEDLKWAVLKAPLPARLTGLISIALGTLSLQEAVTTAPILKQFILTIVPDGTGDGTITADPPGPTYLEGTRVTLTASTNSTSAFRGWSAPCEGATECVIIMNSNVTLRATFQTVIFKCADCFPEWVAARAESYRQYETEAAACTTGTLIEQLQCVNAAIAAWQDRDEASAQAYEECLRDCIP